MSKLVVCFFLNKNFRQLKNIMRTKIKKKKHVISSFPKKNVNVVSLFREKKGSCLLLL
jgi:hypothetical protein